MMRHRCCTIRSIANGVCVVQYCAKQKQLTQNKFNVNTFLNVDFIFIQLCDRSTRRACAGFRRLQSCGEILCFSSLVWRCFCVQFGSNTHTPTPTRTRTMTPLTRNANRAPGGQLVRASGDCKLVLWRHRARRRRLCRAAAAGPACERHARRRQCAHSQGIVFVFLCLSLSLSLYYKTSFCLCFVFVFYFFNSISIYSNQIPIFKY